jgi:hypothetical protein
MRKVTMAENLPAAYLLMQALQQRGIACQVFNQHAMGAAGELPLTEVYPEVWVLEDQDYELARKTIKELETLHQQQRPQQQCSVCQEWNPASFEICWQCRHELG